MGNGVPLETTLEFLRQNLKMELDQGDLLGGSLFNSAWVLHSLATGGSSSSSSGPRSLTTFTRWMLVLDDLLGANLAWKESDYPSRTDSLNYLLYDTRSLFRGMAVDHPPRQIYASDHHYFEASVLERSGRISFPAVETGLMLTEANAIIDWDSPLVNGSFFGHLISPVVVAQIFDYVAIDSSLMFLDQQADEPVVKAVTVSLSFQRFKAYQGKPSCALWNPTSNVWITNVCQTTFCSPDWVNCTCDMLGTYALLVDPTSNGTDCNGQASTLTSSTAFRQELSDQSAFLYAYVMTGLSLLLLMLTLVMALMSKRYNS